MAVFADVYVYLCETDLPSEASPQQGLHALPSEPLHEECQALSDRFTCSHQQKQRRQKRQNQ
jgi:hypothetical protein